MPNVYGDERECMKAVDEMLQAAQAARSAPKIDGETGFLPLTWIFGHYDSRGGAFMVEQDDVISAIQSYIENVLNDDPEEVSNINAAYDDLLGRFEVVVVGGELPESGELLWDYREGSIPPEAGGWEAFRLQEAFTEGGEWFTRDRVLVLVQPSAEGSLIQLAVQAMIDRDEDMEYTTIDLPHKDGSRQWFRLKGWSLGEDACGLIRLGS